MLLDISGTTVVEKHCKKMLFEIPGTFATGIPGNLITENTWQTAIGNPANAAGNPWNIFCWKSITQMLMKIPGTNADGNPWSKCWWKSLEQMLMEIPGANAGGNPWSKC